MNAQGAKDATRDLTGFLKPVRSLRLAYSLRSDAVVVGERYQVQRSPGPEDDMFLACALEGRAEFIVSGDPHLLNLKEYYSTRIVTPRQFADLLRA